MSAEYDDLLTAQLKRTWTSEHEARLDAYFRDYPEERARWQEDLLIDRYLRRLPDHALPSNFTAQIVNELPSGNDSRRFSFPGIGWKLKWAFAPVIGIIIGLMAYQQVKAVSRHELAQGISTVSGVAELLTPAPAFSSKGQTVELPPMPGLYILQDFNAISRLDTMPQTVDLELLVALQ